MSNKQPRLEGKDLKDYANAQAEEAMTIYLSLERERIGNYVREDIEPSDSVEEYFNITEAEEQVIDALLEQYEGRHHEITQEMIDNGIEDFITVSTEAEIESRREEIEWAARKVGRKAMSRIYGPIVDRNTLNANHGFAYGFAQAGLPSLGKRR